MLLRETPAKVLIQQTGDPTTSCISSSLTAMLPKVAWIYGSCAQFCNAGPCQTCIAIACEGLELRYKPP